MYVYKFIDYDQEIIIVNKSINMLYNIDICWIHNIGQTSMV